MPDGVLDRYTNIPSALNTANFFNMIHSRMVEPTYFKMTLLCPDLLYNYNLLIVGRSSLDEDEAFLSTADSAIRLLSKATRIVKDWKGLEYRAAFPLLKPAGANFYPPDMDKMVPLCQAYAILFANLKNDKAIILQEFELWKDSLEKHEQKEATGFFSVIKRHSEFILDSH